MSFRGLKRQNQLEGVGVGEGDGVGVGSGWSQEAPSTPNLRVPDLISWPPSNQALA